MRIYDFGKLLNDLLKLCYAIYVNRTKQSDNDETSYVIPNIKL